MKAVLDRVFSNPNLRIPARGHPSDFLLVVPNVPPAVLSSSEQPELKVTAHPVLSAADQSPGTPRPTDRAWTVPESKRGRESPERAPGSTREAARYASGPLREFSGRPVGRGGAKLIDLALRRLRRGALSEVGAATALVQVILPERGMSYEQRSEL